MHKECTHCMFMSVCSFSWRCVQRCVSVQGWLSEGIAPPFTLGQTSQFCMSCPLPRWARTIFSKPYLDKAPKPSGHPLAPRVMAVGFPWTDRCTAAPQSSGAPYRVRLSSLALWASVFHLHTGLVLALVGEIRGMERENHPVSEQGAWRSGERWTGLDVQLCQEKALRMIWPSSWVVHMAGQGLGPSLPGPDYGLCMLPRSHCTGLRPQALSAVALPAPASPVGSWKPWHPALSPDPTALAGVPSSSLPSAWEPALLHLSGILISHRGYGTGGQISLLG